MNIEIINPMIKYITLFSILLFASNIHAQDNKSYWPKQIELDGFTLTFYQPDPERYEDNILDARAAFSLFDGEHLPIFGALWFNCKVLTNAESNEVHFTDIQVVNANFPNAKAENIEGLQKLIIEASEEWHFNSNLRRFYEAIQTIDINNEYSENLKNNPPKIYYSKVPAVLLFIDGEPIMANLNGSELYQYVVNSPHFIIKSASDQQYYFKGGNVWYISNDPTVGWKTIQTPPTYISQLVTNAGKLTTETNKEENFSIPPKLIVTQQPAELIQTKGEPEIKSLHENLFTISNSDDEILFDSYTDYYYILISGRWYKTKRLERGSWLFVSPEKLPEVFSKIPPSSPVAHIRLSVPGTPESISAALDNAIPQTAIIDREKAIMDVEYDGEPQFVAIEGTELSYAVNTSGSIIKDNKSNYFAVDEAVWFKAESPKGPWKVSDHFPEGVQKIPPSCPVFNIKFVAIYDYTDEIVYVGYSAGYIGAFLYHGTVYHGTGYLYKPWYGTKYISRPSTYGHGAKKKKKGPNISFYASSGGFGYPMMGYGMGNQAAYNQYYYQGQSLTVDHEVDEKPIDPVNIYNNRKVGVIKTETVRRNDPMNPVILKNKGESIYTDADGALYKQDEDGVWYEQRGAEWYKIYGTPE